MGCEDFRLMLDAYIDGELSRAEMDMLREHAKACKACGEEFQAAQLLKDTLAHMDDEIAVPLQAQAAWRSAVRAEAGKNKNKMIRKWVRACGAVAAVLVLALGIGLNVNDRTAQQAPLVTAKLVDQPQSAVVARDGAPVLAAYSVEDQPGCTHRCKIAVEDLEKALEQLEMLSAEYSGSCSAQAEDACIVELPADYLADFLTAAQSIGSKVSSETFAEAGDMAVVHIQFTAE